MSLHFLPVRFASFFFLCALLGAGCSKSQTLHIAEPFRAFPSQTLVTDRNGFGTLPVFSYSNTNTHVTIEAPLPTLPDAVSVLRLRGGLPNETEWRNITGTIKLPGTLLGDIPKPKSLIASWTDPQGILWNYDALESKLDFTTPIAPTSLTLQTIPASEDIIRIATSFFQTRALPIVDMRDALLNPDWNSWWKHEQDTNHCMDQETVRQIREQAKQPLHFLGFPVTSERVMNVCGSIEFPTLQRITSAATKDGLDVMDEHGNPVISADLLVDLSHSRVISGSIKRLGDVDRSDYATIDSKTLEQAFINGGLIPSTYEVRLTHFQQVYLKYGVYLIPAILGTGFEKREHAEVPFSTLVPLTRP
ncbi:hypothetical protein IT408_03370 [Candidatus Uhrbacteria bacterium]|nr:hypothetical protein [Candidatus Uhrbacteria bacterium]